MPKKNTKKLNKYQRKLILDMLIGDGLIKADGRLQIKHSIKQEGYLLWKNKLLNDADIKTYLRYDEGLSFGKLSKTIILTTEACIANKHIRHWLYRPKKFMFYPSFFQHLDDLGIAIWYMDDGAFNKYRTKTDNVKLGHISLSTYVPERQNKLVIDFFKERYNLDFKIVVYGNKGLTYIVTKTVESAKKFLSIVEPYVNQVPCLVYKINKNIFLKDIVNNLNTKDDAEVLNPEVGDTYTQNVLTQEHSISNDIV